MDVRVVATGLVLLATLALAACERTPGGDPAEGPPGPDGAGHGPDDPAGPITLAFAGDIHFEQHLAALLDRPGTALDPIAGTLGAADVTVVNLESAITGRGTPDPKELEDPTDRYWFRTSPAALTALADAGVDVVTMANNHGADYGAVGFADTLRAAEDSPVAVVGVGEDRRAAFTPHRVTVRGTEVAVLAADASMREGRSTRWTAGEDSPGIAAARGTRTDRLLAAVRAADRTNDLVVVYLHWGVEYASCPNAEQRTLAGDLAEAGADVVVGSHTHVLQGGGWLDDTYVGYGLGNFVWYHAGQPDTGVLRLRVVDGRVAADTWIPATIGTDGRPRRLHGATAADATARWRTLRSCTGLADRPATPPPAAAAPETSYVSSIREITPALRERMRSSHRPGCPVGWRDLRHLRMSYVGFEDRKSVV